MEKRGNKNKTYPTLILQHIKRKLDHKRRCMKTSLCYSTYTGRGRGKCQRSLCSSCPQLYEDMLFLILSFFAALIEHTIKTVNKEHMSPLDRMFQSFKVKSSKRLYWLQNWAYTHSHCFLSLFLSIWRWKDLSCCFLLLHYLLPCGALLAGFISDFTGCFWGSLWNVFLTPNNPFPAFSHLLQSPPLSW